MEQDISQNPYLQPENYAAGYQENIEKLKNNPAIIEMDRLCYEVFNTPSGKKLMEIFKERFLIPAIVDRGADNYKELIIWADGFKDFPRMLIQYITSHEQRIKAEVNKNVV